MGCVRVRDYAEKHRLLVEAANVFSTDITAVPALVQRSLDQARELQRQVDTLTEQLVTYEIRELLAERPDGRRVYA